MLTQTISPTLGHEEQKRTLRTQTGGSGNGSSIPFAPSILGPDDDEPYTLVHEAEAFLLRQRINHFLNVTDHCNEMNPRPPLHEQRAYATLTIFGEGGAV